MQLCLKCRAIIPVGKRVCEKCGTPVGTSSVAGNSSVEELTERAKKRDVKAMLELASFYRSLNANKLVDGEYPEKIARKWYEKAALAGNATGIEYILTSRSSEVTSAESEKGPTHIDIIPMKRELFRWYQRGEKLCSTRATGSERINYEQLVKKMEQSRYSLAYTLYLTGEEDEAFTLVYGKEDTPSAILESLIANERAIRNTFKSTSPMLTDYEIQKITETLTRMEYAVMGDSYRLAPKTSGEEFVYAKTALQISRNRVNLFHEVLQALTGLQIILPNLKTKAARMLIENELLRYTIDKEGNYHYKIDS